MSGGRTKDTWGKPKYSEVMEPRKSEYPCLDSKDNKSGIILKSTSDKVCVTQNGNYQGHLQEAG